MEPLIDPASSGTECHRAQPDGNPDELIRCSSIWKAFGNRTVLRDINLSIQRGEKFAILGPSGSGKSTLLRIMAGLESPKSGAVALKGQPIADIPAPKRGVGMVFQRTSVYPHMTVEENLKFPLQCRRFPYAQMSVRINELAELLGITHLLTQSAARLSGGESQRVAIGKALAVLPSLLLLDEPFSNLDSDLRWRLLDEISNIHQQLRLTTILVTHNIGEATYLADRIGILDDGALLQVASPSVLFNRPQSLQIARMLYSPITNFINGHLLCEPGALPRFEAVGILPQLFFSSDIQPAPKQVVLSWQPNDASIVLEPHLPPDEARYWVLSGKVSNTAIWEGRRLATVVVSDTVVRVPIPFATALSCGQMVYLAVPKASIIAFDADSGSFIPIHP